jgi:hypothetical protein
MIKGNAETIQRCRKATPEDKWNHVNFDAIDKLPEEYEAIITEVKFTMNDFANVGSKEKPMYMPNPDLMYAIAEACGISGGDRSINEPLVEEVDINRVRADLNSPPSITKMVVGRVVKKYSTVIQEDGTERKSSVCAVAYNAFERCCEAWSKEEMYTQGYKVAGKYDNKYQTRWQRQAHLDGEMKFAGQKAETKAHLKTIRELAGLMTGYRAEDLAQGVLVFARIRRSSAVLKMETAARLTALARGESPGSAAMLFGERKMLDVTKPIEDQISDDENQPGFTVTPPPPPVPVSKKQAIIATISAYIANGVVHPDDLPECKRISDWASKAPEPIESSQYWPSVIAAFKTIESKIPAEGIIHHGLA